MHLFGVVILSFIMFFSFLSIADQQKFGPAILKWGKLQQLSFKEREAYILKLAEILDTADFRKITSIQNRYPGALLMNYSILLKQASADQNFPCVMGGMPGRYDQYGNCNVSNTFDFCGNKLGCTKDEYLCNPLLYGFRPNQINDSNHWMGNCGDVPPANRKLRISTDRSGNSKFFLKCQTSVLNYLSNPEYEVYQRPICLSKSIFNKDLSVQYAVEEQCRREHRSFDSVKPNSRDQHLTYFNPAQTILDLQNLSKNKINCTVEGKSIEDYWNSFSDLLGKTCQNYNLHKQVDEAEWLRLQKSTLPADRIRYQRHHTCFTVMGQATALTQSYQALIDKKYVAPEKNYFQESIPKINRKK